MADRPEQISPLLGEVRAFSQRLHKAAHWKSSGQALSHLEGRQANRVYEFYCYLCVVADFVQSGYRLSYIPASDPDKQYFPLGPASYADKPRFAGQVAPDGEEHLWPYIFVHICLGTGVSNKYGQLRYPDIYVHRACGGAGPTHLDLLWLMDAKYTKADRQLPLEVVSAFADLVRVFDLEKTPAYLRLSLLKAVRSHALITNGRQSTMPEAYLQDSNIQEVYRFSPGEHFSVRGT